MIGTDYKFPFEKLRVWQSSRQFVKCIYEITDTFPKQEKYCLVDQMRRAVISISSNIAEGSSRNSLKDQAHFTNMAYSSLMEILNQFYIAYDLQYISDETFNKVKQQVHEISNQLNSLRKSQLNSSTNKPFNE